MPSRTHQTASFESPPRPTEANGGPAVALYRRSNGAFTFTGVQLLTVRHQKVARLTAYMETRLAATLAPCATRALMPYGVLAFALVDLLPVVLILGAIGAHVYWISLAVELRRLLPDPLPAVNRSASPA